MKQELKDLMDNKELLFNIVENSKNVFYSHSVDHIVTYISPQIEDLLGYTPEETKIKWTEFASDNPINQIGFEHTMKAIKTGESQPVYELELLHKSGKKVIVEAHESPVVKNGKTVSIVGTFNDITERKMAEKKLEESESRYKHLVETASDAVYLISEEGSILDANITATNMLQRTKEDLIGSPIDTVDPNFPVAAFIEYWKSTPFEETRTFETTHITSTGKLIPIEISGKKFKIGEDTFYYGVARDITDRKLSKEKIIESEEKYKLLHENAGLGIGYYTTDGIVISYNQIAAKNMNGTPEDFIGKSFFDLFPKETAETYLSRIRKAISSPEPTVYEDTLHFPKEDKSFLSTYTKIVNSKNDILGIQIISQDISDQHLAENILKENETKFRGIYEQSPIAIEIYDKTGKLIDVNQHTLDMFGIDDKKYVLGFDLWDDPNLTDDKMKLLKSSQSIFLSAEFDFEIVKKNDLYPTNRSGKMFMDMYAIPLLSDNKITGFLIQIIEVTERKQAEEELKKYRDNLEELVKERTIELEEKNEKLNKFNKLFVDREFRIKDLKDRIKELEGKTNIN